MVLGVIAVVAIIGVAIYMNNKVDIPPPPYIDENGNIDWNKKFELEKISNVIPNTFYKKVDIKYL